MHRLGEAEDPGQGRADRRIGLFHRLVLIPVLQQVGVLALRQPKALIQRHGLDLLALPRPVDHPVQRERTEHVLDLASMQGLEPAYLATVFKHEPIPGIAIPAQLQPGPEQAATQLQYPLPQPRLHCVRRSPLLEHGLHKPQNLPKFVRQGLRQRRLDLTRGVVHALHRGLSG